MKVKLTEMKDADVRFVSLVKRGANRIPFRITKSEKEFPMLDLTKPMQILKGEKAKPAAPEIVAIIVEKQEDELMGKVTDALKTAGFNVDQRADLEDGTTMFTVAKADENDSTIVRLSESMAVVVKGFSQYSSGLQVSSDFNEVMAATGFYQGVRTASDAMAFTLQNILCEAADAGEVAVKMEDVLGKFSSYVMTLTKGLPAAAFKADNGVIEVLKAASGKDKGKNKDPNGDGAEGADAAMKKWLAKNPGKNMEDWVAANGTKADEPVGAETAATEAVAEVTEPVATEAVVTAEPVVDVAAVIKAALEPLTAAVATVTESVTKLAKDQESFNEKVDSIARKAEDATKAINSTVIASAQGEDTPAKGDAVKTEVTDPRTGCFDSATFGRRKF
jgi:hypothetical protein